jgi:hypothetical protein
MEKDKSLAYNFAFEAMPLLFHGQTTGFMQYLAKDGVEFLKFWWNHVGDQLPEAKRVTPTGFSFEVETYDEKTKIAYITLPSPKEDGDPIFFGCVARPEKRFAWVRIPNTAFYILTRFDGCQTQYKTAYGELSPRAIYHEIGVGVAPTKTDFKKLVKRSLEKRRLDKRKPENNK